MQEFYRKWLLHYFLFFYLDQPNYTYTLCIVHADWLLNRLKTDNYRNLKTNSLLFDDKRSFLIIDIKLIGLAEWIIFDPLH